MKKSRSRGRRVWRLREPATLGARAAFHSEKVILEKVESWNEVLASDEFVVRGNQGLSLASYLQDHGTLDTAFDRWHCLGAIFEDVG